MTSEERRNRHREEMTEDILIAAEKVIAQKGVLNASMKEIADEAGIAKGTLYLYFESKAELLAALVRQIHEHLVCMIEEISAKGWLSPPEQLREAFLRFKDLYKEKQDFHRVMFMSFLRGSKEMQDFSEAIVSGFQERLALMGKVFQRGVREGYFRKISPDFAVGMLTAMFHHMMMTGIIMPDMKHPEDFCDQVLEIFFEGVNLKTAPKNPKREKTKNKNAT